MLAIIIPMQQGQLRMNPAKSLTYATSWMAQGVSRRARDRSIDE